LIGVGISTFSHFRYSGIGISLIVNLFICKNHNLNKILHNGEEESVGENEMTEEESVGESETSERAGEKPSERERECEPIFNGRVRSLDGENGFQIEFH
jgi:hypothetical protein